MNNEEQMGSVLSTAFFSPARSSLTYWVPTYYNPLVKPIHSLISAFFPVGRLFGTSRDKPAQYVSMRAQVTVRVVPNMEALPCLQGERELALVSISEPDCSLGNSTKNRPGAHACRDVTHMALEHYSIIHILL